MAEFSYEADIAPMRGSYFSDPSLNDRERRQLQTDYMQRIAPYQEITNKTLERMLDVQNQDLAFKRANVAFEEEKLKLQEARDAAIKYPEIAAQLEDAMAGKKPNEQRLLVADVMMKNPTFFETKNGAALLSSYNAKIAAGAAAEAEDKAKRNQVWSMALGMGRPDVAEQLSGGGLTIDDAASQLVKGKLEAEKREREQTAAEKRAEEIRKQQEKNINRYENLYRNVKVVGSSGLGNLGDSAAAGGEGNTIELLPPEVKFVDYYREDLIKALADLSGLPVDKVKEKVQKDKISDLELRNQVGQRITDNIIQLYRDTTQDLSKPIATTKNLSKNDPLAKSWGNAE